MFSKIISTQVRLKSTEQFTKDVQEAHVLAAGMDGRAASKSALVLETLSATPAKANMVLGMLDPRLAAAILAACTPRHCELFMSELELHGRAARIEQALGSDAVTLFLRTDKALWPSLIEALHIDTAGFLIGHISRSYREHIESLRNALLELPQKKRTTLIEYGIDSTVVPLLFRTFDTFQMKLLREEKKARTKPLQPQNDWL